jgi:hypothetical protein
VIPRLPIHKRLLLLGFYISGIIAGVISVTLKGKNDYFSGGVAGFMCALFLSFLVFPELRNMLPKIWNGNNIYGINLKNNFMHPTQKPMVFGMLWFLIFILITIFGLFDLIANSLQSIDRLYLTTLFLVPSLFLFGLSGIIMIKRKEAIGRFGRIYYGSQAVTVGILCVIFGWGGGIFMILSLIFNW